MAKVDRKGKENQQGEKHSLSSFEKKRGAKIAFNAQARTQKKYRVVNVQKENRDISPTGKIIHGEKSVNVMSKNRKEMQRKAALTALQGQHRLSVKSAEENARQDRFEIYRPDNTKASGFDLIRKKVGLGSGDEDSPKRISSFPDIKAYVDKHSPEAEDKLQEGDIAVFRMGDKVYPTRKEAGEAFKEALNKNLGAIMSGKEIMLGEYRGMQLSIMYNDFRKMPQACLKGEKAHYCDLNIETTTGNIIRLDNAINSIQKTIDDLTAKVETKKSELEQMKIDVEKPFEKEQELAAAEAELEDVHVKLTQFELTDDSAQRDMFERFVDDFTEVLTGEKSYIKYESNCEAFMPLHVEMNSDILTISQTTVQNGDLMYDPRIDFKVDYENKKVIPLNFENSFQGVYEEYDISDGKPEIMKQINDILAFADDWMDEIEVQGYSPVSGDDEIQQTKDNISR